MDPKMDVIREINDKFLALEAEIDTKLDTIKREEVKFEKSNETCLERTQQNQPPKMLTYEEAMTRNANLLKCLEMTKARLRSRSTFSPMEEILEKTLANYKLDLQTSQQRVNNNQNIYDTVGIEIKR